MFVVTELAAEAGATPCTGGAWWLRVEEAVASAAEKEEA